MADNSPVNKHLPKRPWLGEDQAILLADRLFGLHISDSSRVRQLTGYDDRNFYMKGSLLNEQNEREYILKVINQTDSDHDCLLDVQTDAMLFLKARGHQCPTPILSVFNTCYVMCKIPTDDSSGKIALKSNFIEDLTDPLHHNGHNNLLGMDTEHYLIDGIEIYDGQEYCEDKYFVCAVRLLSFVPGKLRSELALTTDSLYKFGEAVGRLDRDLKDFEFPTLVRSGFLWDLATVGDTLEHFLGAISVNHYKELVQEVCCRFRKDVLPSMQLLPKQIIHGDINDTNTIVDEQGKIRGFIDFGDLNYTCRVFEIAISLAYVMNAEADNPSSERIKRAGVVFAGYQSVNPLSEVEIDLLYLLTAARFCQSLVFGAYTYKYMDPGNEYLLNTSEHGWKNFEAFWKTPKETVLNTWLQVSEELKNTEIKDY